MMETMAKQKKISPRSIQENENCIYEVYQSFPEYDMLVFEEGTYRFDPVQYFIDHPEPGQIAQEFETRPPKITLIGEGKVVFKTDKLAFGLTEELMFENIHFVKDADGRSSNMIELQHEGIPSDSLPLYSFKDCSFAYPNSRGNLIWFKQPGILKHLQFENCIVDFTGSVYQFGGTLTEYSLPPSSPGGITYPGKLPHGVAIALPPVPLPLRDLLPMGNYKVARELATGKRAHPDPKGLFDGNSETAFVSFLKAGFRISIDLQGPTYQYLLVLNGFPFDETKWKSHRRIKYADLLLDQQKVMTVELADQRGPQALDLSPIGSQLSEGKRLTLRVNGVYEGQENKGLAITGIYGLSKLPPLAVPPPLRNNG